MIYNHMNHLGKASTEDIVDPNNAMIVMQFNKLVKQIKTEIDNSASTSESMSNYFRLRQIKNVINIIKKYPHKITKGEELKDIKGVGKHSIDRINEIIKTGKLAELKSDQELEEYSKYIDELKEIIGIGPRTAYEYVKIYNITSIDKLKKAVSKGTIEVNHQIQLGLKYHNVYKKNIPRVEIDLIYNYISKLALDVSSELHITICGSYRRLKMTSGDIDVLITHPNIKTQKDFMTKNNYLFDFVNKLKEKGFLLDDLTDKDFEKKYMGFCRLLDNKKKYDVRRMDIRYVPNESYYTALLYFTGSDEFNKKMRLVAIQLGYELSEYGLYKISKNGKKRINIKSEKDVFDVLKMEYLSPDKRN